VVHCTHVVGPIMFGWGAKYLSRFSCVSRVFYRFLTQFPQFEAHVCRLGPWVGPGGGMGLKISRAAHHMPAVDYV
jgi:hypothetical protein